MTATEVVTQDSAQATRPTELCQLFAVLVSKWDEEQNNVTVQSAFSDRPARPVGSSWMVSSGPAGRGSGSIPAGVRSVLDTSTRRLLRSLAASWEAWFVRESHLLVDNLAFDRVHYFQIRLLQEDGMSAFGAVPGLTIFTLASVMLLGATYLGAATYLSFAGDSARTWRAVVAPVVLMFALTVALALISCIAENQFISRISGS